jgi:hypothetical protein
MLTYGQLWNQLRLVPTSVETSYNEVAGLQLITLFLAHRSYSKAFRKRQLHKLGVDVPCHDVQPPAAVAVRSLEAIHLAMNISCRRKRKRRKLDQRPGSACVTSSLSQSEIPYVDLFDEELMQPADEQHSSLGCLPTSASGDLDDLLLDLYDGDGTAPQEVTTAAPETLDDREQPSCAQKSLSQLKRSAGHIGANLSDVLAGSVPPLQPLLYSALTLAMAGDSARLFKGTKLKSQKHFKALGQTAPAIFSPGYLQKVSSRGVFLPTISHSLATVCKRSNSRTLREAFEILSAVDEAPFASNTPDERIEAHFWRLLERGSYDENASQRLQFRPPNSAGGVDADANEDLFEMDQSENFGQQHVDDEEDDLEDLEDYDLVENELFTYGNDIDFLDSIYDDEELMFDIACGDCDFDFTDNERLSELLENPCPNLPELAHNSDSEDTILDNDMLATYDYGLEEMGETKASTEWEEGMEPRAGHAMGLDCGGELEMLAF